MIITIILDDNEIEFLKNMESIDDVFAEGLKTVSDLWFKNNDDAAIRDSCLTNEEELRFLEKPCVILWKAMREAIKEESTTITFDLDNDSAKKLGKFASISRTLSLTNRLHMVLHNGNKNANIKLITPYLDRLHHRVRDQIWSH